MALLMVPLDLLLAMLASHIGSWLHFGQHLMPIALRTILQAHMPVVVPINAVAVADTVQHHGARSDIDNVGHRSDWLFERTQVR
jgi:hypothetical protein